jgi:oligogalacturonide transport system substrate-binding protein
MKKTAMILAALAVVLSTGVSAQAAELRMSWWGGDSRHAATQEALKFCGAKYGHTISPEFTGWSGHQEKVTTQLAGGTEADIMQINWPWLPLMSKDGNGFADLYDLADFIDLSNWTDAQLETGSMAGKLNGLPVSTTGRVFTFNKTTFDKAGVAVPTTWDELKAAAKAMHENLGDDYWPFLALRLDALLITSLYITQQTGKDLIDPATSTVAWTKDELVDGMNFYQSLVDAGVTMSWKVAAGEGDVDLQDMPTWTDGHIAGTYQWDSTYVRISDPLQKGQALVAVPILTSDSAVTEGVYRKPSMMFSISKNTSESKAAAEILNCLLNDPESAAILGVTRGLPASAAALAVLEKSGDIDPGFAAAHEIVMNSTGPAVSPYNEDPTVRDVFQSTLEEFAYGLMSAEEAADLIIEGINERLTEI